MDGRRKGKSGFGWVLKSVERRGFDRSLQRRQGSWEYVGRPSSNSTLVDTDYIDGSTVPNQVAGIFWAILNRLLIIGQTVVLLLPEFGWPSVSFNRFFPVLGDDFGLGALGIIQCLIGAAVLSHHVDGFTLVSAFFLFSIGCLNMLAGLIFRQSAKTKRSVTSWRDHAKSALPTYVAGIPVPTSVPSFVSNAFSNEEKGSDAGSKAGFAMVYLVSLDAVSSSARLAPPDICSPPSLPGD
ncbi:hypothetical protein ARMSODRAFT_781980 [Armillaria solidipes]|uniref:DUF7598 domain-containing protein n=1 Tax=Armillaria solidipes TaxID=1076256 RepID=A0A2H3C487_9AGAR|nr:hypothetical protein ARMSODRAFT_781980 [Armillaria solidipes]